MPEKFATSDVIARAKEWLETAAPRWRLQSMQHRSRYNPKTGEYKKLPMRIRRFLNGTPAGMKAAVLEVLKESAPYSGTVFDLEVDNLEYIPVNTFIRKDGNEHVTNLQDATYTIIQDLRIADDVLDRFGISDSSSCSEYSETEFRWDEPDIDPCPDGSQGIAYQIAGISRDPETDLFSYQIRKVQSLTQYSAPVVSQCDERKRVTVESWNNVYGETGSFRFDPVKGGSLPIEIPEPCSSENGTTIQVAVSKNADCTYRIEVTKIEAKTADSQFSIYRDQYKVQESNRVQNAFSPLDKSGVEYYNGVMKRYTSELNDDGTWNNSIETETERQVPSSTVEVRVTPRATVTTRVDTNFPTAADAVPGGKYGSYKFTKTQGGLFVNEYVQYARNNVGTLGILCTDTAFVKTHEKQDTVSSVPSSSHVPSASRGVVTTWNYDTDADGIVVRRVRTDAEHEVRNASKRASWGLLGTTRSYSHRSVSSSVAEQLLSSSKIGTSVEARMTNGRLWDVEVQSFTVLAGQSLGIDCQKTVYQHVHEISVSASAMGEEVKDAGNGKVYRRSFRRDVSTGAITKSESVTTELEVTESRRTVRVSARGKTIRTMTSNSKSKPADALKPGETTEFEVTPGGRFNVSVEKTEPTEGPVSDECSKDLFQHTSGATRLSKSKADTHVQETSDLSGVYRERRQVLGDDGVWSVSDVEHEEKPVVRQREEIRVSRSGKVKRITDIQVSNEGVEPQATVNDIGKERVVEKTRGGKRNVTSVVVTPILAETDSRCEKDAFSHSHTTVKGVTGKGQDDVEDAGDGNYKEVSYRLNDYGAWEETKVDHKELQPSWVERDYEDAFGSTKITEEMSNANVDGSMGKEFNPENLIRHVESQMTKGKRYNVRTTEEKPVAVSSGHLHFEKKTDKGLAYFYDFVVFRNQNLKWVRNEINWIQNRINYTGWEGSFSNNPGINISPNKFGLWDGSISLTTVFTPKQWASGGSTRDDNFEQKEYTVKDVSVSPLNTSSDIEGIYLLKAVTTEKHKRGGGVGKDKLESAVQGTILRGSTFYYHPSGQAFQYDIITSRKTEYSVIKASDGVEISS